MPDGVVDQQRTLFGVRGAAADGAGEALERDIHRGEPRDPDRSSTPRLHLHHTLFCPQLSQDLVPVELYVQLALLLP